MNCYKKLIERIDAIGDCINPVVVREMRRSVRGGTNSIEALIGIFSIFTVVLAGIGIFFEAEMATKILFQIYLWECYFGIFICISFIKFDIYHINIKNEKFDEMFFTIPLSPLQRLNSYLTLMLLWLVFFYFYLLHVFVLFYVFFNGNLNIFLILAISFLGGIVVGLQDISNIAQIRTAGSANSTAFEKTCFVFISFLTFGALIAPWIIIVLLGYFLFNLNLQVVKFSITFAFVYFRDSFSYISICILLPLVLFANGIMAYKFCKSGFNIGYRTNWKAMLRNNCAYFTLNTILAIIYVIIVIIVK
ncbi:MAG: hypothetical protein LBP59_20750 [Planctomycetaceae bacterium]|jgi:hypothetical protein|nr:hypothetical protein [Planctomycetaceae bacterium]